MLSEPSFKFIVNNSLLRRGEGLSQSLKATGLGLLFMISAVFIDGCASDGAPPPFNGRRAFEYLERQVSFGPRVPGSSSSAKCREYFLDFFSRLGAEVDTMRFGHIDKYSGEEIPMCNIMACFKGASTSGKPGYLFAAHYDSRPRAEYDADSAKRELPIDGANDGASGAAVLMELANLLSQKRPPVDIDLLMLDGEDYGRPGELDEYLLGSKAYAASNRTKNYEFAVVVDLVGDSDLKIYREAYSQRYHPKLNDMIWRTAAKLGVREFIDSVGYAVIDDHISFMTAGIPAADIIDFNYAYWHTTLDTPDKCSSQSLEAVGNVLVHIIYR
jgi:hypothetical protein